MNMSSPPCYWAVLFFLKLAQKILWSVMMSEVSRHGVCGNKQDCV